MAWYVTWTNPYTKKFRINGPYETEEDAKIVKEALEENDPKAAEANYQLVEREK